MSLLPVQGTHLPRRALLGAGLAALPCMQAFGDIPGLAAWAAERSLLLGTMVTLQQIQNSPELVDRVRTDAGLIVPGLEMKWSHLHPAPDRFDFTDADLMVAFAAAERKKIRGHTLIWHEALPKGFDLGSDAADARKVVSGHIRAVCGRYAGRMHSWDVVNEPIYPAHQRPGALRASPFYRALGPDYIRMALEWAAEADPTARLVINDYNVEQSDADQEARRVAILELLNSLARRGAPLHALGIQGHLGPRMAPFDPDRLRRFIRDVAGLGLDVYVTELDIVDLRLPTDIVTRDAEVAAMLRAFLQVVLSEPSVTMVNFWGLGDVHSWMNFNTSTRRSDGLPARGHLYDDSWQRKPAWNAVAAALRDTPIAARTAP